MSSGNDPKPPPGPRRAGAVLDRGGAWEDALRAGQAQDGERGSVEAELAIVHLLRHARAPEELPRDRFEALWDGVADSIAAAEQAAAPAPWWKRSWSWAGGAALAAAAAVVVLLVLVPERPDGTDPTEIAQAPGRNAIADKIERQFALLAPKARQQVQREADDNRDTLRGNLLSDALAAGDGTIGGAP